MKRGIPPKGSIPRKSKTARKKVSSDIGLGKASSLLESILEGLGKAIEGVRNLNLEDLEKLVENQGNQGAKEKINEIKKILGEKGISDLFKEGLDLGKLIDFAAKHGSRSSSQDGGEFSREFAGGKGMIRGGLRGHILGRSLGGKDLPLEKRGSQETKFEVKGSRLKRAPKTEKNAMSHDVDLCELEMDPIEENEKAFIIRGYMSGVEEQDIVCEVKNNGTVLRITATGRRRYEKEVNLSSPVAPKINWSYRNGVLEVTLTKKEI